MKSLYAFILIAAVAPTLMPVGCSSNRAENPRAVVIQLFGAMERDEKPAIAELLDIPALMSQTSEDYALNRPTPRIFHSPEEILDDLTDEGLTKTRWFSMQRVIGSSQTKGDTAYVEVSFINKDKGIQYFTKFALRKEKNRWKIFSFRADSR